MQKYDRRVFGPPQGEIIESALARDDRPQRPQFELPREAIDTLIHVRNYLNRLAWRIVEEEYDEASNRGGVSIDCECFAEKVDSLLQACGHADEKYPSWWPEECKEERHR